MARRMLHDSIWESKQFSGLSPHARLLFIGLITLGDDDGRLKGDPALLRAKIFPRDSKVTIEEVQGWVDEIIAAGLVVRYTATDDDYLAHPNWERYQTLRADRKKDSNIPPPPDDLMTTDGQPTGNQMSAQDKIREGKIRKDKVRVMFDDWWSEYPNKIVKKKAMESWEKVFRNAASPEVLFDSIMAGLERAKKSKQWNESDGKYIPHPTTWLNQERWTDESRAAVTKSPDRF